MDELTRGKWDRAAGNFDLLAARGAERRWQPFKEALFAHMQGKILFLALGTGLDIPSFPGGKNITAIDISPKMLEKAQPRVAAYDGELETEVMDVHDMRFADDSFDQVFTSCTFCSVPRPVAGLESVRRVLKPGGGLFMFEHTGSRYHPFRLMLDLMSLATREIGPDMNRPTVANVQAAGFELREVENLFLDVVRTIKAVNPA